MTPTVQTSDGSAAREEKHTRVRRAKPVSAVARKHMEHAGELLEAAVENERQNLANHERVKDLANKAMGGSFTAILKNCPLLTDDDRGFLKELGYI